MNVRTVSLKSSKAGQEFATSLKETGFAVVTDHLIPAALIKNAFNEWERFFESDTKFKHGYIAETQSGYFPFRAENAKDSNKKDLKEFYHYYVWDQFPQGTEVYTPELHRALVTLASTLLRWVEEHSPEAIRRGFSIPLNQMVEGSRETLLRPIHYPPLKGDEEEGAVRAAAHEDINLITLLPAATAPGLQVKDTSGNWLDVSCDPGMIVVNSGDMLKAASQEYYPSTTHRVMNPLGDETKKPRYSMPLFLHPRKDVKLTSELTAGAYLDQRLREIGLRK